MEIQNKMKYPSTPISLMQVVCVLEAPFLKSEKKNMWTNEIATSECILPLYRYKKPSLGVTCLHSCSSILNPSDNNARLQREMDKKRRQRECLYGVGVPQLILPPCCPACYIFVISQGYRIKSQHEVNVLFPYGMLNV